MTTAIPAWQRRGYSIVAMRELARAALPKPVFDFADGGSEDEVTLRRNESAFAEIELLPTPLNGASTRDLSVTLFGKTLSMPLVIGPTGLAGLFWPGGELASARAAQAAGIATCLSHGSVCTIEDLAGSGVAPRWMQVFIFKDRGFTRELTERAQKSHYDALVLTIDNQMLGNRERDIRNGFGIPPRFTPSQLAGMAMKAPWLMRMRREFPRITFGNYARPGESADLKALAGRMASLLDPSMSWADVDTLRKQWNGPLILKGVLNPHEAKKALDHGIDGIIVSNHGGRQLDGAASGMGALPGVVAAIDGRIPVMVDGGIRRGTDILKALALGASATLMARPHLWGLAVAGEAGVKHVLDIYRRELDRAMGLCGAASISAIGKHLLLSR
jgi:L-lactate dehydrogenase (cytochrome)/(S)-mandelate dehydrogenase